jgi:hypothetical protein
MICSVVMMTEEAMARIHDIGRTNNVGREDDGVHETISIMMRVTLRFNTYLQATIDCSLKTKIMIVHFLFKHGKPLPSR